MKAGILYNSCDIRPGDVPEPRIKPDEVLVKSLYAGICGTDLHVFRGEFEGRVAYPAIQGHEFGGIVEEVGSDVTQFEPGDRVAIDPISVKVIGDVPGDPLDVAEFGQIHQRLANPGDLFAIGHDQTRNNWHRDAQSETDQHDLP